MSRHFASGHPQGEGAFEAAAMPTRHDGVAAALRSTLERRVELPRELDRLLDRLR